MSKEFIDKVKNIYLAAEKGDANAQYELGKLLTDEGLKWLHESAERGHEQSAECLNQYNNAIQATSDIDSK